MNRYQFFVLRPLSVLLIVTCVACSEESAVTKTHSTLPADLPPPPMHPPEQPAPDYIPGGEPTHGPIAEEKARDN